LIVRTKSADHVNESITAAGITISLISRAIVIAHIADSDAQTYGVGIVNGAAIVVIQNIKERPFGDSQFAAIRLTVALTISRSTITIITYVDFALDENLLPVNLGFHCLTFSFYYHGSGW